MRGPLKMNCASRSGPIFSPYLTYLDFLGIELLNGTKVHVLVQQVVSKLLDPTRNPRVQKPL